MVPAEGKRSSSGRMFPRTRIARYVSSAWYGIKRAQFTAHKNYLGHSINAPTGRWQKNKDVHWYQRDEKGGEEERREELRKVKEAEAEALAAALCVYA